MKHKLPPLDSLKAFESAARHLSFSLAADELCVTKSAISYQIRKLEENIDCALFKRSVRQIHLTEAGQELQQLVQRQFAEIEQIISKHSHADNQYDASVGATTYVALRFLSPRIARFNNTNPNVLIIFRHSVNSDDFKLHDVDMAIKWGKCNGRNDTNRLLEMPMPLFPVCAPGLLNERYPNLLREKLSISDISSPLLNSIPLLCEPGRLDMWGEWYGKQSLPLSNPRRIMGDANVRAQAAIDGQGWVMADAMMNQELINGTLIAPFDHQLKGYGYILMSSPSRYTNKKVRALRTWLLREMSNTNVEVNSEINSNRDSARSEI